MQKTKVKFTFKSRKDKDADGNVKQVQDVEEIKTKDKDGKEVVEKKLVFNKDGSPKMVDAIIPPAPPVELDLPLMELSDIVAILNGPNNDGVADEKQVKLILEACNNIILERGRELVNDNPEEAREKGISEEEISWKTIAELPPSQRKGAAISDEVWEAFEVDYIDVMKHHGKTEQQSKMGAKLFRSRFQSVKTNKKVLKALQENLRLWFANSSNSETFQDVYESLSTKVDTLLAADEEALVAAV
jgi:hypothetical protein